ncbi:MAG: extracellular solute-binding protein [Clostridia bacterium]|nr:extracellular solute-binding protein [Clostridia bacterium]
MNKRTSLLLTMCLLIAMLAGCSGGDAETSAPETGTSAAETTSGETTAEETGVSDDLSEYDFDGRQFQIVYSEEQLGPLWPYAPEEENGDRLNDAAFARNMLVEERFNCSIGYTSTGGNYLEVSEELRKAVMAGDNTYQLAINHMYAGFTAAIADRLLYDFNDLPAINLDKPWWNQSIRKNLEVEGVLLTAVSDLIYGYYDVIYFNKDIMDDHGIAYPYENVHDGSWTWTYLAQITKDITRDLNGDSKLDDKDAWGFVIDSNISTMTRLIHSNGMVMATMDETGRPTLDGMISDKMHTVVERYYDFVWNDDRCYYATKTGTLDIADMFLQGNSMMMHTQTVKLPTLRDAEFAFGIVPLPKYDEAQEGYYSLASTQMLLLPANMEDPEFTGVILEALSAESYRQVVPTLYDVVYENKLLRDEESRDMFNIIRGTLVYDYNWNYGDGNDMSYLIGRTVGEKNADLASYFAAKAPAAQLNLDKVYETIVDGYAD